MAYTGFKKPLTCGQYSVEYKKTKGKKVSNSNTTRVTKLSL